MSPDSSPLWNGRMASRSLSRRLLDPKVMGGALLLVLSMALGWWAVTAASQTEELYALTQDVAVGTQIDPSTMLTVVESHPGSGSYLRAGEVTGPLVATRPMRAGELVPAGAVATAVGSAQRTLVLTIAAPLPADSHVGDRVDVWALPPSRGVAPSGGSDAEAQARIIAAGVQINSLGDADRSLLASRNLNVEVVVPEESVAAVLSAVGAGTDLVLVRAEGEVAQ